MNTLEKCAEILVACKYAQYEWVDIRGRQVVEKYSNGESYSCAPFADTLEGRRQANAIEDWLHQNETDLLNRAKEMVYKEAHKPYAGRKKRLDRMDWCVKELIK